LPREYRSSLNQEPQSSRGFSRLITIPRFFAARSRDSSRPHGWADPVPSTRRIASGWRQGVVLVEERRLHGGGIAERNRAAVVAASHIGSTPVRK
jgi:hypothetical protein